MTGASNLGAWGGDEERKRSVVATVLAAVSGNTTAVPSVVLYVREGDGAPAAGNGYCVAFRTVDPVELEAQSGLPASALQLIGAALAPCCERNYSSSLANPYWVPATRHCLVDALAAIRPGADLVALPARYVATALGELPGFLPPADGATHAPLAQAIRRIRKLHLDALGGRTPDDVVWAAARLDAVAATDAATSPAARVIGRFVEAVAWSIESLGDELPLLVDRVHVGLTDAERESRTSPAMLTIEQSAHDAYLAINLEAASQKGCDAELRESWMEARIAESADIRAYDAPEFQARLTALARAACDTHGPRAYRLLIETLKQL